MKDISNMKDYRKKFKRYYGIDFSRDYVVHHIDFNRENNDISNLMLLPRKLHSKYHLCIEAAGGSSDLPFKKTFDARIGGTIQNCNWYEVQMMMTLFETLEDCAKWYDYKLYLDGYCPNIHGIELE